MKNYTFLFVIFLFLIPTTLKAQLVLDLNDFYQNVGGINIYLNNNESDKKNEVIGSPYAQTEFINGTVIQNDGTVYKNIPLKYNIYNDQIVFKHKNNVLLQLDSPNKFKEIIIGKQKYIYGEFMNERNEVKGYYETLEVGKISLLKKEIIYLLEAQPAKAFKNAESAKLARKAAKFFILKEGNKIYEIKGEKNLLILLDNNEKINSFIKKNKLKHRKIGDLIKIISYYNEIS